MRSLIKDKALPVARNRRLVHWFWCNDSSFR